MPDAPSPSVRAGGAATDPAKAKATTAYNAASDHFDDDPLGFWGRYGERTVARLGLPEGARVLDVGCGSGASAIPAARAVGPAGRVVGVDLAERLLEMARRKAVAHGLANTEFLQADMESLGYPDGAFDAVVCNFAIFFVPGMARQVSELWRLVRPGGALAITTWGPHMFEPGSGVWRAVVKNLRPDLHSEFNPWDRITSPESVRELLAEAGVAEAEIEVEVGRQPLRAPEDWWTVVLGSGYRWTVDQMGRPEIAAKAREASIREFRASGVAEIETNVIYALARKPN